MSTSLKITALLAISASLFQSAVADLPSNTGELSMDACRREGAKEFTAGSSEGSDFCASQQSVGALISGIKVWTVSVMEDAHPGTHYFIDGMHVLYDNNKYTEIGRTDRGTEAEFFWWPNDSVVAGLYLCPPGNQDHLIGLAMALDDGRWFIPGCDNVVCSDSQFGSMNANFPFMDQCNTGLQGQPFAISGKVGSFGIEQITFKMW